ncbi:MAG: YlmC/YmxH family sporulation protein [Clostridia bacterium]|nr:YlmC/YmxH family sporulation protein [Clostridia bacterium]
MTCCFSNLRDKEIICVQDGRRLGYVCDLELDPITGKICALIVPGTASLFSFARRGRCCIPWENIVRIGDDIILVSGAFPVKPPPSKK